MENRFSFEKLLKSKTNNVSVQIIRYIISGIIAIGIDFLALYILTEYMHIYYLVSAALAFGIGLATNYLLSIVWVFNKRKLNSKLIEFTVFVLTGLLGLGLTELIIWFFTEFVHFHYIISKGISFIVIYTVNFYIRKKLLF